MLLNHTCTQFNIDFELGKTQQKFVCVVKYLSMEIFIVVPAFGTEVTSSTPNSL